MAEIHNVRTVGDLVELLGSMDPDLPVVLHAEIVVEGGMDVAVGRLRVARNRNDAVVLST